MVDGVVQASPYSAASLRGPGLDMAARLCSPLAAFFGRYLLSLGRHLVALEKSRITEDSASSS